MKQECKNIIQCFKETLEGYEAFKESRVYIMSSYREYTDAIRIMYLANIINEDEHDQVHQELRQIWLDTLHEEDVRG